MIDTVQSIEAWKDVQTRHREILSLERSLEVSATLIVKNSFSLNTRHDNLAALKLFYVN